MKTTLEVSCEISIAEGLLKHLGLEEDTYCEESAYEGELSSKYTYIKFYSEGNALLFELANPNIISARIYSQN